MRTEPLRRLAVVLALWTTSAAASATLSLGDTLASSREHFPRIQAAVQETLLSEGRVTTALGAFDLALEQDGLAWGSGFYEGRSLDSRLVKPVPFAGGKIYGGYRVTDEDFPVYQQELVTNSGGEFNLGVVFSLWRDREIDKRRFDLASARLGVREARIDLTLATMLTQRNAAHAYWRWVNAGRRLETFRVLLKLAEGRMSGLERRATAGDVAAIFVTENRQNLLRRQARVRNAERDFEVAAIELSLYLRDDAGMPRQPAVDELPARFPDSEFSVADADALVAQVLEQRPELAR
ncbi:MAG: TolC family protein, partial [Gammaproteobacteria bacterium]